MTAETATKPDRHVASNPDNFLKSEAEVRAMCWDLLGGMIRNAPFVITERAQQSPRAGPVHRSLPYGKANQLPP
ncbi:hypothetical protein [Arthrobacter rhombi]|uniref:hypothetical protein n=1 Tax=Arthrobacter rhombi TaxID=71253 RepID=UPI003FD42A36